MKKLLLFALIILSFTGYGQKFTVTPEGLRDSENNENTYVVIDAPNMTAKQLYDNAVKYINQNYKNPEEVIKGQTDGEYLKFETYTQQIGQLKSLGFMHYFSGQYYTELYFKDGKVKFEIITFEMLDTQNKTKLYFSGGGLDWVIYKKNGKLSYPEMKTDLENYFNEKIIKLTEFLQGKGTDDNW
ncbi:MAG: hypothetical protein PF485_11485 [Bacteroidales bacterium]|jgi:hypothetical protein|nr:hypothetical protein [Bacteroidales bacterium]